MNRHLISCVLAAGFVCLGTGCASIVSGTHRKVTFNTDPTGAKVTIADMKGRIVSEGTTPYTIKLLKGKPYFTPKKYTLTFAKEGYWETKQDLKATVNGWYMGNLVFGGLLGLVIVDPLTGAMWTLPKDVHVSLNPKTAASSAEPELRVVHLEDIPITDRPKLVRIN